MFPRIPSRSLAFMMAFWTLTMQLVSGFHFGIHSSALDCQAGPSDCQASHSSHSGSSCSESHTCSHLLERFSDGCTNSVATIPASSCSLEHYELIDILPEFTTNTPRDGFTAAFDCNAQVIWALPISQCAQRWIGRLDTFGPMHRFACPTPLRI